MTLGWGLEGGPVGIPSHSPSGGPGERPWSFGWALRGMPKVTLLPMPSAPEFLSSVGDFSWIARLGLGPALVSLVLRAWVC